MNVMGKTFKYGDNIDTDVIIPARYLSSSEPEVMKAHCMEDIDLDFAKNVKEGDVIVAGKNFGCGSSREHAPFAIKCSGISCVIAKSFARIFRQNMYNCGMIAIELAPETIDELFRDFAGAKTTLVVSVEKGTLTFAAEGCEQSVPFTLNSFERALVEAGGWLEYAAAHY